MGDRDHEENMKIQIITIPIDRGAIISVPRSMSSPFCFCHALNVGLHEALKQ